MARPKPKAGATGSLRELRRILVPVDFSDLAQTAVECAIRIASISAAELILIHVVEKLTYPGDLIAPLTSREFASQEQKQLLARLRAYVSNQPGRCRAYLGFGRAWVEICKLAQRKKCSLIVMSRRGSAPMLKSFLGSVAEKVVRHAPCAVLTIT